MLLKTFPGIVGMWVILVSLKGLDLAEFTAYRDGDFKSAIESFANDIGRRGTDR